MSGISWRAIICNTFSSYCRADVTSASATVEFHVSRSARDRYEFDDQLFSTTGNVIFGNFHAARQFTHKMNAQRDLLNHPEQALRASDIYAMGLMDEMFHGVVNWYRQNVNPRVIAQADEWLRDRLGPTAVDETLLAFVTEFPTVELYRGGKEASIYLAQTTDGIPNRLVALEELLMLWLANANPALRQFHELFDDSVLRRESSFAQLTESLRHFFTTQPGLGSGRGDLLGLLTEPIRRHPHSLQDQLRYMVGHWQDLIRHLILRVFGGLDFLTEEGKATFTSPPPTEVSTYSGGLEEPEQFSQDWDWMPSLVLMAKSTLIWLDQLSQAYGRTISRLDEIPDQELDKLAGWGFTGLWLIGVWQRCSASRQIKRSCGNPEAEASAYSLFDYEIAEELGGESALENLRMRCWRRGIRLACDMVPNHTGIDSDWVRKYPDRFISLPYSPFPAYSFKSQNLSEDPRYVVQIDDKYYSQEDAAVVFRREDTWTGEVRFIYHGNDGTNMPWNDTAQLDYINPEVREAVIERIIHVARLFPVIRFDAAMTLAKKHIQRLWYPEPGRGGDIPSRAEFGLQRKAFDDAIPVEFWREVVDRVAAEVPDCLLLAEAFWFMEGYFVRTLGMHRVYNSSFMNMLKNEENRKYRQTIINTLQFNPEILKRFVNFMNNPDEDTAIAQFGDNDKYFGVCLLLVTMPGLPMFGHGQVEGFHEKYGMEYGRAYWDETPNDDLVARHEREIFPLMKRRYLFSGVESFVLYDFMAASGELNDNVFAYSNCFGAEKNLIVYNNKFENASGWIRASVPFAEKADGSDEMRLVQRSLRQGLGLSDEHDSFLIFRDDISGLEFIRNSKSVCEQGLYFELGAFKYQVITTMYEVRDDERGNYARLTQEMKGQGVASIREAFTELRLGHVLSKFVAILNTPMLQTFMSAEAAGHDAFQLEFGGRLGEFLAAAAQELQREKDIDVVLQTVRGRMEACLQLISPARLLASMKPNQRKVVNDFLKAHFGKRVQSLIFCWLCTHSVGRLTTVADYEIASLEIFDEWLLRSRVGDVLADCGHNAQQVTSDLHLLQILIAYHQKLRQHDIAELNGALRSMLEDATVQQFIGVNRFQDTVWFNKEQAEFLVASMIAVAAVMTLDGGAPAAVGDVVTLCKTAESWMEKIAQSKYRLADLMSLLSDDAMRVPGRKLKS